MPRPALPEIQARHRHPRRRSGCQKYYGDEDAQKKMKIKDIICNELEEQGEIKVSELREKVFPGSPEMLGAG